MIRYRRCATVGRPNASWDYTIEVDGRLIGHVFVDRAGRQSGTISRWVARDLDGNRLAYRYSFRDLKEELGHRLALGQ